MVAVGWTGLAVAVGGTAVFDGALTFGVLVGVAVGVAVLFFELAGWVACGAVVGDFGAAGWVAVAGADWDLVCVGGTETIGAEVGAGFTGATVGAGFDEGAVGVGGPANVGAMPHPESSRPTTSASATALAIRLLAPCGVAQVPVPCIVIPPRFITPPPWRRSRPSSISER